MGSTSESEGCAHRGPPSYSPASGGAGCRLSGGNCAPAFCRGRHLLERGLQVTDSMVKISWAPTSLLQYLGAARPRWGGDTPDLLFFHLDAKTESFGSYSPFSASGPSHYKKILKERCVITPKLANSMTTPAPLPGYWTAALPWGRPASSSRTGGDAQGLSSKEWRLKQEQQRNLKNLPWPGDQGYNPQLSIRLTVYQRDMTS